MISSLIEVFLSALKISKTTSIVFNSTNQKPNQWFDIKTDDEYITQADSAKYLGVTFDADLRFKTISRNVALDFLKKICGCFVLSEHFVNRKILIILYYPLIYRFLIYSHFICGL